MTTANQSSTERCDIAVVGAGLTGLTAALLLSRDGHRVVVLERDPAPPPAIGEDAPTDPRWDRRGVPQFRHAHVVLPRWHREIARELPDVLAGMRECGAVPINLLRLRGGRHVDDEPFDTLAIRRPLLEAVLAHRAAATPGVSVRRGIRVTGVLRADDRGRAGVRGLRTDAGDVAARIVLDAAGRRTPIPHALADAGLPTPESTVADGGLRYFGRHFRVLPGREPQPVGPMLTHHEALSVITIPGDAGTFAIVLAIGGHDQALRALREPLAWTAVARSCPTAAAWMSAGEPITPVAAMVAGPDRVAVAQGDGPAGLIAIGDAAAATEPLLGRGVTLGLLTALLARDAIRETGLDPVAAPRAAAAAAAREVVPWVAATVGFAAHRRGELAAAARGRPYVTDDPGWRAATALLAGARTDPALARAAASIGSMVATPTEVFADPDIRRRLPQEAGPTSGPSRADVLAVLANVAPRTALPMPAGAA